VVERVPEVLVISYLGTGDDSVLFTDLCEPSGEWHALGPSAIGPQSLYAAPSHPLCQVLNRY
jgi:hypothetical protein